MMKVKLTHLSLLPTLVSILKMLLPHCQPSWKSISIVGRINDVFVELDGGFEDGGHGER